MSPTPHEFATRIEVDGARWYRTPGGDFPSVTTILEATKSREDCLALAQWRARIGIEEALRYTAIRAAEGEAFHLEVEEYLGSGEEPAEPSAFFESARSFLSVIEPLEIEARVWHRAGFGGTLDLLGVAGGKRLLLADWKSSRYVKQRGWIRDYELQIAAYRKGAEELTGYEIEEAAIVIAVPGERAGIHWLDASRLDLLWGGFLGRLELFNKQREQGEVMF